MSFIKDLTVNMFNEGSNLLLLAKSNVEIDLENLKFQLKLNHNEFVHLVSNMTRTYKCRLFDGDQLLFTFFTVFLSYPNRYIEPTRSYYISCQAVKNDKGVIGETVKGSPIVY